MFNEQRRQAYLKAMGIQVYYPRRVLPGAAPSPHYELGPEAIDTATGGTGASVHAAAQRESGSTTHGSASPGRQASSPGTMAEPAETLTAEQAETGIESEPTALLRFVLHYQQVNPRLAVLSEIPPQAGREAMAQAGQLLQAVLLALEVEHDTGAARLDKFTWPLLPRLGGPETGAEYARQALAGFVLKCRERDQFSDLLVFSAQIDGLLPGAGNKSARDFPCGDGTYRITCTHSLHSMLALPALKREAWAHMQPLRQRLRGA